MLTERNRFNEFDVNFAGGGFPTQVTQHPGTVRIRLSMAGVALRRRPAWLSYSTWTVLFEAGNQPLPFSSGNQAPLCAALS